MLLLFGTRFQLIKSKKIKTYLMSADSIDADVNKTRPIITKGSIFSSHSLECLVSFDPNIVGHSCADSMNSNPTYLPGKVTSLSLPGQFARATSN